MDDDTDARATTQVKTTSNPLEKVEIVRDGKVQTHRFDDFFKGFDEVEAVRKIFVDETEKVLDEFRVEFVSRD